MRQWFRPLPVWVGLILVPGACALAAPAGSFGREIAVIVLASTLAFFLTLAAHEAGHLLGGCLAGFRFALYAAGPIKVRRSPRGLRFEVNDRWNLAGFAFSVPVHLRDLKRGMVSFTAGGLVANLLLAAIVAGLFLALARVAPSREAVRAFLQGSVSLGILLFVLQAGFLCLLFGIMNLVPLRSYGFLSDGARLLMLLRGGAKAERWSALWALYAASAGGQRPRDWDRELIDRATQLADGSLDDGGACLLAYLWALDQGDEEAAEGFLDRARAAFDTIPALRSSIAAEIAYYQARFRGDAATARARLDQALSGTSRSPARRSGGAAGRTPRCRGARACVPSSRSATGSTCHRGRYRDHACRVVARHRRAVARERSTPIRAVAIAHENSTALRTGRFSRLS